MADITVQWQVNAHGHTSGDIETVERTDYLDRLLAEGVVAEVTDTDTDTDEDQLYPGVDTVPGGAVAATVIDPPARNASRAEWATFLTEHGVEHHDEDNRDTMIAAWEHHSASTPSD